MPLPICFVSGLLGKVDYKNFKYYRTNLSNTRALVVKTREQAYKVD